MKNNAKIMVYDSGAGGLSIAREILRELPTCQLVYAADNAFFPYGTKDDEQLSTRIIEQVGNFQRCSQADIVVIACNTASTLALNTLRATFNTPFVGVVPAIKPAALESHTGIIGILATSATTRRPYTHQLIREFAPDCSVVLHGSDALVAMAEAKICGQSPCATQIHKELDIFIRNRQNNAPPIDTLVLACTHFPLLREEIAAFFEHYSYCVNILDSGAAIAQRVKYLLNDAVDVSVTNSSEEIEIVFSDSANTDDISSRYRTYLTNSR